MSRATTRGGSLLVMWTVNVVAPTLPTPSAGVQVTSVSQRGKTVPLSGTQVGASRAPDSSVTLMFEVTLSATPSVAPAGAARSSGCSIAVSVGGVTSPSAMTTGGSLARLSAPSSVWTAESWCVPAGRVMEVVKQPPVGDSGQVNAVVSTGGETPSVMVTAALGVAHPDTVNGKGARCAEPVTGTGMLGAPGTTYTVMGALRALSVAGPPESELVVWLTESVCRPAPLSLTAMSNPPLSLSG